MEKRGIEIPVEIPASVREALGDRATLDFLSWFVKAVPSVAVTREEFKEVVLRLEGVEKELKNMRGELIILKEVIDGRFEAIERRFETLNARFDAVHERIDTLRKDVDERIDSLMRNVDERIDVLRRDMDERIDALRRSVGEQIDALRRDMDGRIDALRKGIDERSDSFQRSIETRLDLIHERMLVQSRWLVGSIAILGTVISILLAIGQFLR